MTPRTRLWLYCGAAAAAGFLLNGFAVVIVMSGSGGPGLPPLLAFPVYLAFWPTWLAGMAREQWFYPDLLGPIVLNIAGWSTVGVLAAVMQNAITRSR